MKPILHLLGIPHTLSFDERYSHCAFTTKVNRFAPMLRSVGYEVRHYGNGSGSPDVYHTPIFSKLELEKCLGKFDPSDARMIGDHAHSESLFYREFNARLARALNQHVQPGDIICCPFGIAHLAALRASAAAQKAFWVETGIGYEETFAPFRVFESSAWMHYHYGKKKQRLNDNRGSDYDWVIPNYFDIGEWDLNTACGEYVLYFGRIGEFKGMEVIKEIALRRPDLKFVICGQGDATPWLTPNMEVRPPIHGRARSELIGKAIAVLVPSRYVEPFGGVAVEAMLCGRPVLASVFGAFSETLHHFCFQCRTLKDWLDGLSECQRFSSLTYDILRQHARQFDMYRLAEKYDSAFQQIFELRNEGWYAFV